MTQPELSRFFIALLPPQDIQEAITDIKHQFAARYASRAALKSPPHITLQPPFTWKTNETSILTTQLQQFAATQSPLSSIVLDGFAAFAPKVIYVNVIKTPQLLALQQALMTHCETALEIIDAAAKSRPFTPHMTVAFRDLTRQNFHVAWREFQHRPLSFQCEISQLTLLLHDGQRWQINQKFPFDRH